MPNLYNNFDYFATEVEGLARLGRESRPIICGSLPHDICVFSTNTFLCFILNTVREPWSNTS